MEVSLTYGLRALNVLYFQYTVYCMNVGIGGRERNVESLVKWSMGYFTTPYLKNRNALLLFTVQCSGPLQNFQYANVSLVDTARKTEQFAYVTMKDLVPYDSNAWFQYIAVESYTKYQVFADFGDYHGYRDCLDIRVNTLSPVNYWVE